MWFDSWADIIRVLIVGSASYVTLVLVVRITGKRTLAQLNAFDFIVTVALGSTLATIFLSTDVSWAEGAVALGLLAVLQLVVAFITSRRELARRALTAKPTLLVFDGRILPDALKSSRLAESEVRQAVRSSGCGDLALVAAVVLETNGKLSVISSSQAGDRSALEDVRTLDDGGAGPDAGSRDR